MFTYIIKPPGNFRRHVNLLTFTQAALLILIVLAAITFGAQKIGVLGENLSKGKTIINN
ncbi:MAG: hypothetical protein N3A64_03705 [Desulfobacterota bacterium]|nr:hypothetical protein [Thermodesulfobacteriota bacterium]